MKKFITVALSLLLLQVGIVIAGANAGHADSPSIGRAESVSIKRLCTTVSDGYGTGDTLCVNVWRWTGNSYGDEGRSGLAYAQDEFAPDCVKYVGWSSLNVANGRTLTTMRSKIKAHRWHIYKAVPSNRCQVGKVK